MAIGPIILVGIIIIAAVYWLNGLTNSTAIKIDDLSPSERKISILYWRVGGEHRNYTVEVTRVFLKRDTVGEKHLHFESIDANGKRRTFNAERVLKVTNKDGSELRQFNNYLRRIMEQNVNAQAFTTPQHS